MKSATGIGISFILSAFGVPPGYHWTAGHYDPIPASANLRTDAIAVFTGESERTRYGYELYNKGASNKILISGVNPDYLSPEGLNLKLINQSRREPSKVFIDFAAQNTIQNAQNTANWIKSEKIHSVRLVTADYHMRRAYFELRRLLPSSVQVFADPIIATPQSPTFDNEGTRLACRTYETAFFFGFCYDMRKTLALTASIK